MKRKFISLLSSGLDSTVNAYEAMLKDQIVMALTFNYGQRASAKEIENAKKTCLKLQIPHQVIDVPFFKSFTSTSLVNTSFDVPRDMAIDDLEECNKTAQSVWVPNRNGIFINIAAGFAEGLGADAVLVGFNKEEAATFPDNTPEYIDKLNEGLGLSTLRKIKVHCYTTHLTKTEIVKRGRELNVDFTSVWPCYFGADMRCGHCESCLRFDRAINS